MDTDIGEPRLQRIFSRRDLILYGLVLLTPTAAYPVLGVVQQTSMGHGALCYVIAMAAMLITAASCGKLSNAYPSAGYTYNFAQEALSPTICFLAGWAMILDYFLIPLLSVVYASLTASRMLPEVPYAVWAVLFTVSITAINIRGLRVTAWAGNIMIVLMTVCAIVFVVTAGWWVVTHRGFAGLFEFKAIYNPQTFSMRPVMLGAAIASLSYIGFDAISTLAEDTINPERDISIATVLVCLIQTVFCVATVYLATLVWPDFRTFLNPETAILDVGRTAGGNWLMGFLIFILLVAGLASALTGQAGASRLLLGMGRDGVLPPRIFAYIDPKYSTPTRGIYLMGAISLIGSLTMHFQLVVELLNFGAFVGFILVNLSVIRHFYLRLEQRHGIALVTNLLFLLAGTGVCTYLWLNLTPKAHLAGFCWLGVGLVWLAVLTRGFRIAPKKLSSLANLD